MRASLHDGPTRHQRAWLAATWSTSLRSAISVEARATIDDWVGQGRPVEVTHTAGASAREIPIAITLPSTRWLARLAFTVAPGALVRRAPPPLLSEALPAAPTRWIASLSDLDRATHRAGVPMSVTGALAWQHHTGEHYLAHDGAVELLFRPRTHEALAQILGLLRQRENWEGPRLGGEVVLGHDDHVSWRDLALGRRRVLVRGAGQEVVADVDRLLATLR